jgi:glucokinase
MTARWAVAVDVGGTAIKGGLVSDRGELVERREQPTDPARGPEAVVEAVAELVDDLLEVAVGVLPVTPAGVGVVVPGIVDDAAGVVRRSVNLGWHAYPLAAVLEARLGRSVLIGQDVRAGGVAEARLGAGRPYRSSLFVPLGTGIAMAFVDGGTVLRGETMSAGELGHIVARPGEEPCRCGNRGCLETVASANAIAGAYNHLTGHVLAAADVAGAVRRGDPTAERVWLDALDALADGLAICTLLLDPGVIILGGGLARSDDLLVEAIEAGLTSRLTFREPPPVAHADLGEWAGCVGAGLTALDGNATPTPALGNATP